MELRLSRSYNGKKEGWVSRSAAQAAVGGDQASFAPRRRLNVGVQRVDGVGPESERPVFDAAH